MVALSYDCTLLWCFLDSTDFCLSFKESFLLFNRIKVKGKGREEALNLSGNPGISLIKVGQKCGKF